VVHADGDRVSAVFASTPAATAVALLATAVHATVVGTLRGGDVHAVFDAVALPDALGRLLGDQSFTVVYNAEGRLRRIDIIGAGTEMLVPSAAVVPVSPPGVGAQSFRAPDVAPPPVAAAEPEAHCRTPRASMTCCAWRRRSMTKAARRETIRTSIRDIEGDARSRRRLASKRMRQDGARTLPEPARDVLGALAASGDRPIRDTADAVLAAAGETPGY